MNDAQDKLASAPSGLPPIPATKILGIGHFPTPPTTEQRKALGLREVSGTVRPYRAGKNK
jgi:hypothetical protein